MLEELGELAVRAVERLDKLRDSGVLTDAEYEVRVAAIRRWLGERGIGTTEIIRFGAEGRTDHADGT